MTCNIHFRNKIFGAHLRLIVFLVIAFALIAQTPAWAHEKVCNLTGKVVHVADGDTIKVLDTQYTLHKVRLAGIDAPEKHQAFGNVAKTYLSEAVKLKTVCVNWQKRGRYGRIIGTVYVHDTDVNLALIERGLAWHYKKYQKQQSPNDRLSYGQAEISARQNSYGLWRGDSAVAPWEWRKQKKLAARAKREASLSP